MGHPWKNESHMLKWVTLGTKGDTWINGSHLKKKRRKLGKKVTLGKKRSQWNRGSHLGKWVTLEKVAQCSPVVTSPSLG